MQQIGVYFAENTVQCISRLLGLGMLTGLSVVDIRCHRVPWLALIVAGVMAGLYCLLSPACDGWLCLGGLLAGAAFLLISKVTREGLGYGDSWLLCILGAYLGLWDFIELLAVAWMGAALAAVAVLISHRYKKGSTLPMVPFITAGYVAVCLSEMLA